MIHPNVCESAVASFAPYIGPTNLLGSRKASCCWSTTTWHMMGADLHPTEARAWARTYPIWPMDSAPSTSKLGSGEEERRASGESEVSRGLFFFSPRVGTMKKRHSKGRRARGIRPGSPLSHTHVSPGGAPFQCQFADLGSVPVRENQLVIVRQSRDGRRHLRRGLEHVLDG